MGWTVVTALAGVVAAGAAILLYLQGRKDPDAAAGNPRKVLPRSRGAAARRVTVSWRRPDNPAAVVRNDSRMEIHDGVVTVTCNNSPGVPAPQEFDSVEARKSFEWSSGKVHEAIDARARGREPVVGHASGHDARTIPDDTRLHRVEATFGVGTTFWHMDSADKRSKRLRSLVIWTERTRAVTLEQYFGRHSAFFREYRIKVEVKPFAKIQDVEGAFIQLPDKLPDGHRDPPDIVVGPHDWIGRVAAEELVTDPLPIDRERYSFHENAIGALSHQGRLYAIPYVFDSVALIRNDALTSPGDMPATIDELLAPWQDAVSSGRLVLALQKGPYHLWPLFASVGGTFFGMQTKVTPHGVQPVEMPGGKDFWRERFINAFAQIAPLGFGSGGNKVLRPDMPRGPEPPGALEEFLAGGAPYLICASRALQSIKTARMKVTVGPVPRLGDQPAQPLVSVYGFFIYRDAPNLPAARNLLSGYLSNPEAGLDLNKFQPLVPVQRDAMRRLAGLDPLLAPYIGQCKTGMIMPTYKGMRDAWDLLRQTGYTVLAGNGDPAEIAAEAFDEGRRILDEARSA